MADAHELLDMETFEDDKLGVRDAEMMDPVLMADSETLCQTLSQICELEQQAKPAITFLDTWMNDDDEIRPPEALDIKLEPEPESRRSSTNSAVEQALYGDDDDDDVPIMKVEDAPVLAPLLFPDSTPLPLSPQREIDDADLPEMLDMFSALYSDPSLPPAPAADEPKCPLSIHIPAAHPTLQVPRMLAPHSTPSVSVPSYFNAPCYDKGKTPAAFGFGGPPPSLLSPPYPGCLAMRTIVKSRTPKALPRLSMTPDIAEQKLNRIFLQYADPMSKTMQLAQLLWRLPALLKRHRVKEDSALNLSTLFPPNDITAQPFPYSLFGPDGAQTLTLEAFQGAFQICNRCTELKRKQHATVRSGGPRELADDVAPVIVRVVPSVYEGPKIKSCDHFQWTWCEGFDKTHNEKCNGTNRHDKCPKYLANCTLWKHRLPPKNRKASKDHDAPDGACDAIDSPAKKLKFFS
ncbi:hypothetical protein ACHHYP_07046 [Achlya hypogyna]|uniref:Uncharacterized protein n=1 Tax=Achlya hypogyna TaxID=1202772 RepID=A0A1V9YRB5_ACHHY|nr:hypothetical protein ACHHYP_07046 [Achlya hypogyna]